MAYGVKYQGSVESLDGSTYTVKIWKTGYSGGITTIQLGDPPAIVSWGERGADIYRPLRPSSAEIMIFDKADLIRQEIFNADENTFLLQILKDGGLYWLGKPLTDIYRGSLDLQPKSASLSAIDGLGQLDGIGFDAESRVSFVQAVADILAETILGLNIRFACNWFTPDILSSEDPCARINAERIALWKDDNAPVSAKDAFEQLLERLGLVLFQSGGVWWVVQWELLGAATFRYFEYDAQGAYVSIENAYNPAVTIAADVAYSRRHADGERPYKAAWKTTTVIYTPKADSGPVVTNGSFEDWVSEPLPPGWTHGGPGNIFISRIYGTAKHGNVSVKFSAHCNPDPNAHPLDYLGQDGGFAIGTLNKLRIRLSAQLVKNENQPDPVFPNQPRKAYFRVTYGNYYLRRDVEGTCTWIHVGEGPLYDDYIVFNKTGLDALKLDWIDDEIVTPSLPDATGQITIRLYQVVEFDYDPENEAGTAKFVGILYDNISVDLLLLGATDVVTNIKTVTESIVLPNTQNRDRKEFTIGDGPSTLTPSRLTVGSTTLTGNWKRGPYGGEQPTGKSIDALLAETWLRAQKTPLEIHDATYISRPGVLVTIEPHNVLVIGTQRFGFVYLERALKAAHSIGEWVEVKAEDADLVTGVTAVTQDSGTNRERRDTAFGDNTTVGSETFASGFAGSGWSVRKEDGKYVMYIDRLVVRESMQASELLFMQKRVFNGSVIIGRTGTGRPLKMEEPGWD